MDPSQASVGEKIAAGSAVVLFISLFLPWYGVSVSAGGLNISETGNAWEALSGIDVLLFLCAVTAAGVVVARLAGALPELPVPPGQILLAVGAVALLFVLYRIIDIPAPNNLPDQIDFSREWGIFVALIAAAAMAYGGFRATQET
ncbi:MAG: hypothetical protein QOG15_2370 [Solirubrobacteraceae bacterium]|jgi:hypothetical protein|nr:hypothetical protein [Solirubrobacteraceae bacterium]